MRLPKEVFQKIIQAVLPLLQQKGWGRVTLRDFYKSWQLLYPSLEFPFHHKNQLLQQFFYQADYSLASYQLSSLSPQVLPKEVLFELLIVYFDALRPYQPALKAILATPEKRLRTLVPQMQGTMQMILEAARISTTGTRGWIRVQGLLLLFMTIFPLWLEDDTEESNAVMAALDQRLALAEEIAGFFSL